VKKIKEIYFMNNTAYMLSIFRESPLVVLSISALLMAIATLWYPTRVKLPILFFIIYVISGSLSGFLPNGIKQ